MKQGSSLTWLVPMVAVIALIVSGVGLFSQGGGGGHHSDGQPGPG